MKLIIAAVLLVVSIWPLQAQDNSFELEPEPPSIIARISFISPKLIAEIAPSEYFTLSTGFWLKTSFWDFDESGQSYTQPYVSSDWGSSSIECNSVCKLNGARIFLLYF